MCCTSHISHPHIAANYVTLAYDIMLKPDVYLQVLYIVFNEIIWLNMNLEAWEVKSSPVNLVQSTPPLDTGLAGLLHWLTSRAILIGYAYRVMAF